MTIRTVGTLTALDLGAPCRVEWEGWIHTGSLDFANHDLRHYADERITFLGLRADSGSRWMGHLPIDHRIEISDKETP